MMAMAMGVGGRRKIGEVCQLQNGRAFKPTEWCDSGVPIIRIQNLNDSAKAYNYFVGELPSRFKVCAGDVLLSWSGTPGTSFGCFIWAGPDGWLNQHIFKVIPSSGVSISYLYYAIGSVIDELVAKTHGSTMKHVVRGDFENTLVYVPPLAEQQRIVEILDRAAAIQRLRKAAEDKAREIVPALFVDMFGDPATNPKGWRAVALDEHCDVQGGVQVSAKRANHPVELPYLRVANVYRGILDLSEIKNIRVTEAEAQRTRLNLGDILMVEGHGNPNEVGRAAVWDDSIKNCTHQNHLLTSR